MIIPLTVIFAVAFLAYANGANDNFKGVASLYGSKICSFRTALTWATITTMAGSVTAVFLASALLKSFSGKGLVSEALSVSPAFVLAVAIGAGATVLLATRFGFPISTTHALTGSLVGAGVVADSAGVNYAVLGNTFLMPLLLSPFLALVTGALIYLLFKGGRKAMGIKEETCICVGEEWVPVDKTNTTLTAKSSLSLTIDDASACERRYHGRVLGLEVKTLVDQLHFLSAGAVSFARGLNDTPKIAALLLVAGSLSIPLSLGIVAVIMALGGLLQSKRVAHTMSHKLTDMNPGQGFAANISTALLVTTASFHGMPVSTTHVSVGGLLGMGTVTGQAKWKTVMPVLASWVITLPVAILFSALSYYVFQGIQ